MMKIKDIIANLDVVSLKIPEGMRGRTIAHLCHNSRAASPTCLFFCRRGALTDGHRYAMSAYEKGARFFVVERDVDLPKDAAIIKVVDSSLALRRLSVIFCGDPSKSLRLIGITGTKGKTTVALTVYNIAVAYGIKMGYIGTNGIYYNGKVFETANTTPDCLELQSALREMKNDGVTDVVIEVSSQALWQERTYGLSFDVCAFTNLYEDHIGGVEHPTFEHYRDSKKRLFTDYRAKSIIINSDCADSRFMIDVVKCADIVTTSAAGDCSCDLFAKDAKKSMNGIRPGVSFRLFSSNNQIAEIDEQGREIFIPIPGLYSIENALIAIAICTRLGIDIDFISDQLSRLTIAGRFEMVELDNRPNTLFVIDYAHNGASLSAVLRSLREYNPKRIIVLFGSVGGRTFGRRTELGKVAKDLADVIILTSDNPDNDDPTDIIDDIMAGVGETDKPIYKIPDRSEAIEKAFEISEDGDFVLLAGKGHEGYQLIRGSRVSFSERRVLNSVNAKYYLLNV